MKKLISVLLAILMLFSMATVAFATDETTTAPETSDTTDAPSEDMSIEDLKAFLENLSPTEAKFIFKIAKIAVKLILVLDKLGFVDVVEPLKNAVIDMIKDAIEEKMNAEETTAAPVETTAAPVETTVAA